MDAPTSSNPAASQKPSSSGGGTAGARSYKDTLNLPKTAFAMKANLVQNEPASLKRWAGIRSKGLYQSIREARKGRPRFSFHDGPPYANGSIHLGHLMNKCLKDFVVRSRTMAGMDCPFVPGWDCHGLPIEHKVMTELAEAGKLEKLSTLSPGDRQMAVRRECRKYAEKFHKLHTQQMSRLLTLADYDDPYLTMQPAYEAATLEVLAGLISKGLVYRAVKPVHWSVANETALADAELEYYDREDISVYVDFEAADADAVYDAFALPARSEHDDDDADSPSGRPETRPSFMIWTTTPWTLPANLAVAVNPKFTYALARIDGNICVLAEEQVERIAKAAKAEEFSVLATASGERLLGLRYRHPFVSHPPAANCGGGHACKLDGVFTVVAADYVTLEDGTGLVHTAPGHGTEDYQTGLREALPIYCPVRADGAYDGTVPEWLRGKSIWKANSEIVEHLRASGHLFFDHAFSHSYPHDWRSKTPVIFRCTEQWFVSVDGPSTTAEHSAVSVRPEDTNLRRLSLHAVDAANPDSVRFVPEWGRNRLRGMLESRPDWCISRQRAWGLPIPAFFIKGQDAEGAEPLLTAASVMAVVSVIRKKGSDAWFTDSPADLLAEYKPALDPECPPAIRAALASGSELVKGNDILDVWFESGSSWNAVMRQRSLGCPVDLYLEGSDQHRGWFQLSLLPALGVTGSAPYRTLLTHGFMVDKDGRKLSKSMGDTVEDLFQEFGADVLRWWVSSLSYENDVKVDKSFFAVAGESYRKVRNTLRFMLSNLDDFSPTSEGRQGHCVELSGIPPTSIDAWVLSEFDVMSAEVRSAYEKYDFRAAHALLYDFCNSTLSAVYLAAVKDRLYCDRVDSARRRQTQTALWELTDGLCRLLAPILCHTADEAHRSLSKIDDKHASHLECCIHLKMFLEPLGVRADPRWTTVFERSHAARVALERAKTDQAIENPLDAEVVLPDAAGDLAAFDPVDLADLLGVSRVSLDHSASAVRINDLRDQPRCERSWRRDGTVRKRSDGGLLSDRDAKALGI